MRDGICVMTLNIWLDCLRLDYELNYIEKWAC